MNFVYIFYNFISAFVLGYALYDWGEREHTRLERKNPADYANDV